MAQATTYLETRAIMADSVMISGNMIPARGMAWGRLSIGDLLKAHLQYRGKLLIEWWRTGEFDEDGREILDGTAIAPDWDRPLILSGTGCPVDSYPDHLEVDQF